MQLKNNLSEQQYFIEACFCDDLQEFYKTYIQQSKSRIQVFMEINNELMHLYWSPTNICCESGELLTRENIGIKTGYWTPFVWKAIRKDLLVETKKNEAFECQLIDCSCNDCKHLNRSESSCNKFNKIINITPNKSHPKNLNCFEHRKLQL